MTSPDEQVSERFIGLEGATNFRDFGGYATRNGQRVRWGALYRSNKMSALTDADRERLEAIGIRTIFDLRAGKERDADPTLWAHPDLRIETYPPGGKRSLEDMARAYPPDCEGARALMAEFYTELPDMMAHAFGAVLRDIAAGATPCIVHCSAGKDRTGITCAMILWALGVDRETILADYVMTQSLFRPESDMTRAVAPGKEGANDYSRFTPDAIKVLMAADMAYLDIALTTIAERHGSVDAYIEGALRLTPALRDAMKERLLISA